MRKKVSKNLFVYLKVLALFLLFCDDLHSQVIYPHESKYPELYNFIYNQEDGKIGDGILIAKRSLFFVKDSSAVIYVFNVVSSHSTKYLYYVNRKGENVYLYVYDVNAALRFLLVYFQEYSVSEIEKESCVRIVLDFIKSKRESDLDNTMHD